MRKFQHLGRDLDTLRVNYMLGYIMDGVCMLRVYIYTCMRVTHRDVEEFMDESIVVLVSFAFYFICSKNIRAGLF